MDYVSEISTSVAAALLFGNDLTSTVGVCGKPKLGKLGANSVNSVLINIAWICRGTAAFSAAISTSFEANCAAASAYKTIGLFFRKNKDCSLSERKKHRMFF